MLVYGSDRDVPGGACVDEIADALVGRGWVVAPGFAPPTLPREPRRLAGGCRAGWWKRPLGKPPGPAAAG